MLGIVFLWTIFVCEWNLIRFEKLEICIFWSGLVKFLYISLLVNPDLNGLYI